MWLAARRLLRHINNGQNPHIFHMGDHDPSGIDMSEDIQKRLEMFIGYEGYSLNIDWDFSRIALNRGQIKKWNPPSDPAKLSDSRSKAYIEEHGDRSWELDALSPAVMNNLILDSITEITDSDLLLEVEQREQRHQEAMQTAVDGLNLEE